MVPKIIRISLPCSQPGYLIIVPLMLANLSSINSHILIYFAKWFRYKRNHVWNEPDSGYRTVKPDCCFLSIRQCCAFFLPSAGKFKAAGELELAGPSRIHCGSPKWTGHPNVAPYGKKKKKKGSFGQEVLFSWYYPGWTSLQCDAHKLMQISTSSERSSPKVLPTLRSLSLPAPLFS